MGVQSFGSLRDRIAVDSTESIDFGRTFEIPVCLNCGIFIENFSIETIKLIKSIN